MARTIFSKDWREYRPHEETWGGFRHLVKWFVFHMAALLSGLYFLGMTEQNDIGTLLIVFAVVLMIYGIVTIPRAGRETPVIQSRDGGTEDRGLL
jgi:hypothetical protein